jgi:flagellar biogenesis protein FliO
MKKNKQKDSLNFLETLALVVVAGWVVKKILKRTSSEKNTQIDETLTAEILNQKRVVAEKEERYEDAAFLRDLISKQKLSSEGKK